MNIPGRGLSGLRYAPELEPRFVLEKILGQMKRENQALLIALDDVRTSAAIRTFASVYQILIKADHPLVCIMTGTPEKISALQNDSAVSFLLRSRRIDLPMLSAVSVYEGCKQAFQESGKVIHPKALEELVSLIGGYPYALQLLGFYLWDLEDDEIQASSIKKILDSYRQDLFQNAYKKIFREVSKKDQEFLLAMAGSGKAAISMKEIAESVDKKPGGIGKCRMRLMDDGLISSPDYGYVAFTLPLFDEYIRIFEQKCQVRTLPKDL